ncbi:hypothetical protein HOD38_04455 [archaeon]|mgnify:CR=1 FL=1|jgi:hypothetical protein|nr:hypothetical protein [archaeon]MBT4397493.1 hypothetical protein [archaeon]MBT4440888.1 hypothetical protein [archaeon]
MEKEVKKDVLTVLRNVYSALKKWDADSMKFTSDYTLHNSSMYQDQDSVSVAVIVYSLYKICSRERIKRSKDFRKFQKDFLDMISEAQSNLSKDKVADYRRVIKKMFAYIGKLEKKFGMYITEVIKQSRIKKGGRIFEHGVSVGRVSELLGVSSWEMMNYIGNTKLSDIGPTYRKDVEGRLEYARRIFNV